jgi:hypothetical protein
VSNYDKEIIQAHLLRAVKSKIKEGDKIKYPRIYVKPVTVRKIQDNGFIVLEDPTGNTHEITYLDYLFRDIPFYEQPSFEKSIQGLIDTNR